MGLLDVLNGMQNGPRGQRTPGASGGGMSPITMALRRCSALWEPSLRRLSARLSAGTAQIRGLDLLAQQWGR